MNDRSNKVATNMAERDKLEALAAAEGMTLAAYVRRVLLDHLAAHTQSDICRHARKRAACTICAVPATPKRVA